LAEESDLEKTESASPRRLEKARESGDVPRSTEFSTLFILLSGTLAIWFIGSSLVKTLQTDLKQTLNFGVIKELNSAEIFLSYQNFLIDLGIIFLPILGIIFIAAVCAPLFIGGWTFSAEKLIPDFTKLNPIQGISNIFSINSLVELLKAILKTLFIGFASWLLITSQIDSILSLLSRSIQESSALQGYIILWCLTFMVVSLSVISMIDVPYQIYRYSDRLKMSRQELRDESKETEGNPEIKAKIRAQQREMSRRRMMSKVPSADVVITNPTHYSVALQYQDNSNKAPIILAKGQGEVALKIRELAKENNIEIVELPPLARALYKHAELDQEIPSTLFTAVAQVLAYVFQLRVYQKQGGLQPQKPTQIAIPAGLDILGVSQELDLNNTTKAMSPA
jgi:flagellar biosynthetic protein FlhB